MSPDPVEAAAQAAMYRAYHFAHSLENVLELERQDAVVGALYEEAKCLRKRITAQLAERVASQEEPKPIATHATHAHPATL